MRSMHQRGIALGLQPLMLLFVREAATTATPASASAFATGVPGYRGTGVAGGSWQLSSSRLHVSQRASVVSPGGENPLHPGQFFGYRNHENQEAGQAA